MKLAGIHHVSINVSDLDRSVEFYTKTLGLTLRTDRPALAVEGVWLDLGPQQVHLIVNAVPTHRGQHFAVAVDDLDASLAELHEAGVTARGPVPVGEARQASISDPDGNLIELQGP